MPKTTKPRLTKPQRGAIYKYCFQVTQTERLAASVFGEAWRVKREEEKEQALYRAALATGLTPTQIESYSWNKVHQWELPCR